mmetsp:Transcript_1203/g.3008  ORF Transcript_1203/g.3008 Transcript_1203/m.3008 type:complete len:222 (+) Transcript_1203:561-1226(+)
MSLALVIGVAIAVAFCQREHRGWIAVIPNVVKWKKDGGGDARGFGGDDPIEIAVRDEGHGCGLRGRSRRRFFRRPRRRPPRGNRARSARWTRRGMLTRIRGRGRDGGRFAGIDGGRRGSGLHRGTDARLGRGGVAGFQGRGSTDGLQRGRDRGMACTRPGAGTWHSARLGTGPNRHRRFGRWTQRRTLTGPQRWRLCGMVRAGARASTWYHAGLLAGPTRR